jgi:Tol biopolymer transport system component/serine/threonine protein kinase
LFAKNNPVWGQLCLSAVLDDVIKNSRIQCLTPFTTFSRTAPCAILVLVFPRDKWAKVDEILDGALDRRAEERSRWLDGACEGDAALKAEVERMLELAERDDDLLRPHGAMEGPVWDEVAGELLSDTVEDSLEAGTRLGPYEVVGLLGRGGMGKVYRARHPGLDREVAVKALSAGFKDHPSSLRRFEREAKLLASLNHPNIASVYDLIEVDEKPYLILELVEGDTLQQRIARGRMSLDDVIDFSVQLVDALEEAHGKGVIHRDLKPSNVKLSEAGRVKVLDFGLAKAHGATREAEKPHATTQSGIVLGTPGYMSPEQARGQTVDKRADIWAFGCLLYEMLSGERAFGGETSSDAIASVLRDEVEWKHLPVSTPPELLRLLRRCLQKDPKNRFQDIGDARVELAELTSGAYAATAQESPSLRWKATAVAALLLLVVVLAYVLIPPPKTVPRFTHPVQVTSDVGREDFPSWSPDGRTLAYAAIQGSNWDVYVTQVDGGQPLNRTSDHEGTDFAPGWSPDGAQIAFRSARDGGGIYAMSPLSGSPRKLVDRFDAVFSIASPLWTSDGAKLAYVVVSGEPGVAQLVEFLDLSTGQTERLSLPGRWNCRCEFAFSPDGRFIAYVDAQEPAAQVTQLWVMPLPDGEAVRISDGRTRDWSPTWSSDGDAVFFLSNRGGSMDLWYQPIKDDGSPDGPPEAATVGIGMQRATFSRDGTKLAYSKGRRVGNLFRIPVLEGRLATWSDAEQLTFDQARVEFVDVSPDGSRVVVSSDRSGNPDLWSMPAVGGELQQLTDDPTPDWLPAFSPDGSEIAFYAYRSGNRDLWIVPSTGGQARQVTRDEGSDSSPGWSRDGKRLLFYSNRSGSWDLWSTATDGTEVEQLTEGMATDRFPRMSPDGEWILYSTSREGEAGLWLMPVTEGSERRLTEAIAYYPAWSPDGRWVYFTPSRRPDDNLWSVSVDGGEPSPVSDFKGKRGRLGRSALAVDGDWIYFTWEEDLGDIWVMDVEVNP